MDLRFSVLTTIQAPTPSVVTLVHHCHRFQMPVLAIGDRKSPIVEWPDGSEFVSLDEQGTAWAVSSLDCFRSTTTAETSATSKRLHAGLSLIPYRR